MELLHGDVMSDQIAEALSGALPFDVITCSSALIYLPSVPTALRRFASWLAPGGRLAVNSPKVPPFHDRPRHCIQAPECSPAIVICCPTITASRCGGRTCAMSADTLGGRYWQGGTTDGVAPGALNAVVLHVSAWC